MQSDYVPDGWLGLILGSKIYVDFTLVKYPFDESMDKLKGQLNLILEGSAGSK
jgi:hypothetical protein